MKDPVTTTNLADFGFHEREELIQILRAWHSKGLPYGFDDDEVVPMFNRNSGNVFLTNSDYQVAMLNGQDLEIWHSCPNCGHEGFKEDCQLYGDRCNECKLYQDFEEEND